MTARRKDSTGHVLRDGESQRKDGSYMYRYMTISGSRKSVYGKTLSILREKEAAIQRDLRDGIDTEAAKITVSELVEKVYNLRSGRLKHNSQRAYGTALNRIKNSDFGKMQICKVTSIAAKEWFISLNQNGLKRNTLSVMKNLLNPAFETAVENDMIRKNPFKFKLSDFIPDEAKKRTAIPKEEQEQYLDFIRDNSSGTWIYEIIVLLETGMRVSELYGLTFDDLDFQNKRITVNKQLCQTADRPFFIETPKSVSGNRIIPMSDKANFALQKAIAERRTPTCERVVDGVSGFLFLDVNGNPKVAHNLDNFIGRQRKKYVEKYGDDVTFISPHVFRHTFSTNMSNSGINPKHLQSLMGHSRIEETLNTYTHAEYQAVEESFWKCVSQG